MTTNIEKLEAFLDREDLSYRKRDDCENVIQLEFDGETADMRLIISVEDVMIRFYTYVSICIPAGSRNEVAVAVCRANYGLMLGNFELDVTDGEMRFKISHVVHEDWPSDLNLNRMLHTGLGVMNRYLPAFLSIVYGNETAQDAVQLVEQG